VAIHANVVFAFNKNGKEKEKEMTLETQIGREIEMVRGWRWEGVWTMGGGGG
jgi:hypothetical protein